MEEVAARPMLRDWMSVACPKQVGPGRTAWDGVGRRRLIGPALPEEQRFLWKSCESVCRGDVEMRLDAVGCARATGPLSLAGVHLVDLRIGSSTNR